jgi:methionyl-tRNA synthetase
VRELNWFFRLSRYREPIRDAIRSGRLEIVSDAARAETLAFLDGDVRDLSVSRPSSRSAGWGIPVPDDPSQTIYVWFDALANYVSSLGLGSDETLLDRYWRAGERLHVIGKGISRFHAVYWPAFLLAAGLPLPDRVLVHGYITVHTEKLSKSGKNLDVAPVVAEVGTDALRWFFVRRCRTRNDTDISTDSILSAYDTDLADKLGNLVQRCTTLAARVSDGIIVRAEDHRLRALAEALPARVDAAVDAFLLDDATGAIVELIDEANRSLERTEPWRLARTDPAAAAALLYAPLEAARIAAGELEPFVPGVARAIAHRLGDPGLHARWGGLADGARIRTGSPPLPRKNRSTS